MATLRRAIVLGVAFGLAASAFEAWTGLVPVMQRRFGPSVGFMATVVVYEMGLGAGLGLLFAPLLRVRAWLHPLAMTAAWLGLQMWVALDSPMFAIQAYAAPLGALALFGIGAWIAARRGHAAAWIAGAIALAGGLAAPGVYLKATTPSQPPLAELSAAPEGAPDVVLVVLDTVRASHVSTYGYARETAPTLDALSNEGALFTDATSPSTWSLPSHASLFTGRYPSSHGAHAEHPYLDGRFPTLAQVLQQSGYDTYCFTANAWISDGLGLTRGFAWQDTALFSEGGIARGFTFIYRLLDRVGLAESDKGGGAVTASFERWAQRSAGAARPAFVFLNFIESHFPYHQLPHDYLWKFTDRPYAQLRSISVELLGAQFGGHRPAADDVAEPTVAMYDGGVLYADRLLGRVVEALRARGRLDRTVLVVMADHGELLGEREQFFGHGPSLYQPSVGVPLLVRYPPGVPAGARVETPVSTLGVFATILDLAHLEAPPTLQVGSLAPLIRGEPGASGGPILSELHDNSLLVSEGPTRTDPQMLPQRRYRLLRDGDWKLVVSSQGDALLYDLAADPGETRDVAAERPDELAAMLGRLAAATTALALPDIRADPVFGDDAPELDAATKERLRALGYATE